LIFNAPIDAVTLLDRALTASELGDVVTFDPKPPRPFSDRRRSRNWSQLAPGPVLDLRPSTLSPSLWFAQGLGGRQRFYEHTLSMLADYPHVFGAGPGSFGNLYKIYLQDSRATDEWYVHDDFLETRFSFGLLGAALVYLALGLSLLPLLHGGCDGIPAYFIKLVAIGIGGCLLHARFDWVLQTHPILFLTVVLCAFTSGLSARRAR
jgi:hypothetical protein